MCIIVVNSIFNLCSQIYEKYGFITTTQTIFTLISLLYRREPITSNSLNRQLLNTHPDLKQMILQYASSNWVDMLQIRKRVFFTLFSVLSTTIFALIRPMYFIRFTFGVILSSLGILWHETLSSYDYLKKGAIYVIHLLDIYGFHLPIPSLQDIMDNHENHSSIYTVIGVLLLGSLGIALSIILLEYYIPPINEPIPLTYLERLYPFLHLDSILSYWEGFNIGMYSQVPGLYDHFLTPIKNYLLNPIWNYGIVNPLTYSYDYFFHPLADGIRKFYDYFFSSSGDKYHR